MAQALTLLELPSHVRRGVLEPAGAEAVVPLGLGGLDAILPDRGLLRGGVTELAVAGGAACATSLALAACRSAQEIALAQGGQAPWCAFVDPTGTLHAPGVARAGVRLDRLLVVRPPLEALGRVAVKLAEAHAFSVLVVDTVGTVGSPVQVDLGSWPRIVRRLSMAAAGSGAVCVLVTDRDARRPLPLPVATRLELARPQLDRLTVRVAKDRRGRVAAARLASLGVGERALAS
jgi:hypothetical protein